MTAHHTSDSACPLCEQKLVQAHVKIQDWFHSLKPHFPDAHLSWTYRDEPSQEECFREGTTKLHYPASAHNKAGTNGAPLAMAADLFEIHEDGHAVFSPSFYASVNSWNEEHGFKLLWGAKWRSLGDNDHFQLPQEIES